MKRILVIDESEIVRETLALILGREFVVTKKPVGAAGIKFSDSGHDVDLLILGVTPAIGLDAPSLVRLAAGAPFAVLFLVDSRTAARAVSEQEQVGCLVKPFNPYELRQKVGELLARRAIFPKSVRPPAEANQQEALSFLTFPFLSRTAATLIHRFAATRWPLLVSGERGCGQERVVRGLRALSTDAIQSWISLNGAGINAEYLAQKAGELAWSWRDKARSATLLVENLDKIPVAGQSALLSFLEEQEDKCSCRLLASSKADLLERVYAGNFLEPLYYKFATLTVTLLPLRDRRDDIPLVASWFARRYAQELGLAEVTFAPGAKERLGNYLWFGNLNELETVIARTLAVQRKTRIDASDLIFVFTSDAEPRAVPELEEFAPTEIGQAESPAVMSAWPPPDRAPSSHPDLGNGRGTPNDLKPLIRELAHELKNPMVTIKTFAQLLSDRYQDENFRTRFQEVVGGDIERMDDLLEVMMEFADFSQPRSTRISLERHLRSILDEIGSECTKRQATIHWHPNGASQQILADEDQLGYILKNVLLTVLSEVKMGSEIAVEITEPGLLVISYWREGARMASIAHYFKVPSEAMEESVRPLRILLAKKLLERIGAGLEIDSAENDKEIIKMGFPIA